MDATFKNENDLGRVSVNRIKQQGRKQGIKIVAHRTPTGGTRLVAVKKGLSRGRRNNFVGEDYFLKKTFDSIGKTIKQGSKNLTDSLVKSVGKRAGADPKRVNEMIQNSAGYNAAREKFANTTKDVARDAAISIATLGVGAAASGVKTAGQGVAAGVNAGKAVQAGATGAKAAGLVAKGTNLAKTAGNITKAVTAGGAAIAALKKKDPKAAQKAMKDLQATGYVPEVSSPAFKDMGAAGQIAETVRNIGADIPEEIQGELLKSGKKLKISDIIENGRTSKELLPKTRSKVNAEEKLMKKGKKAMPSQEVVEIEDKTSTASLISFDNPKVIIGIIVFALLAYFLFKKAA